MPGEDGHAAERPARKRRKNDEKETVAVGLGAEAGTKNTDATSTDNGAAVAVGFMASAQKTGAAA